MTLPPAYLTRRVRRRLLLSVLLAVFVLATLGSAFAPTYPILVGARVVVALSQSDVARFPALAVGPVLLVRGVFDFAGVVLGGMLVDRRPHLVMIGSVGLMAASLLGMSAFATSQALVVGAFAVSGFSIGAMSPALTQRVLEVAPGNTDLASATNSAAFNVGIAGGAALGGGVLSAFGLLGTALVGGIVVTLAVATAVADPVLATASSAVHEGAS